MSATPRTITLTLGGYSVVLGGKKDPLHPEYDTGFTSSDYPRKRIETPKFGYSAAGASNKVGSFFEPKHTWTFSGVLMTSANYDKLQQMFEYWLQSNQPNIVISDDLKIFKEAGTVGTRPISSGTESTDGSMVSYYAQFNARFVEEPAAVGSGAYVKVSFVLSEGDKLLR